MDISRSAHPRVVKGAHTLKQAEQVAFYKGGQI